MKLFDLFATLTLDSGGFDKGLSDAQKRVKAFSESIKAGVQTAMKIGAAVAAAGAAVGGYVLKTGIGYNQQMDDYTANMQTLLGGVDKAEAKIKELSDMAAKTPFELPTLADATQTLLAFGVKAEDSTGILKSLGDISLGNASKFETLTRSYGKMSSTGKVTLENVQMMIDAGFNPLNLIAERNHMTMESLYEALSDGKVPFDELTWAIQKATSEGGQFYNGMETASKTLTGRLSTLKENWSAFLALVTKPAYESLRDTVLPSAIDMVNKLTASFNESGLQGVLDTFSDEVGKLGKSIASKITEYFDSDQAKTDLQNATGKIAKMLTGGNIVLSDVTSFITNILTKINDTFADDTVKANLASTGENLIKGILAFEEGKIKTIISGLTVATNVATGLLKGVSDYFSSEEGKAGITNIILSLGNAIVNLGQTAINAVPALVSAGAAIYEGIVTAAANNIINFFDKFSVDDFLASASAWWAKVKPGLEKILQANVTITYKIYKKVAGAVLGEDTVKEIESTNERMQQVSDQLQEDGVDIVSGATPTGQEVLDAAEKVNQKYGSNNPRGFATGLYSVPYDNFPALLHRNETVLTRAQADEYRKGGGGSAESKQDIYNINIQSTAESPSETAAYIKQAMRTLRFNQA
nr:MAG TPA: tail tape measure protein [Caudoviricetes sp.]